MSRPKFPVARAVLIHVLMIYPPPFALEEGEETVAVHFGDNDLLVTVFVVAVDDAYRLIGHTSYLSLDVDTIPLVGVDHKHAGMVVL
jgi:hypothetical protein